MKRRYAFAIVVLAVAVEAAILFPSSHIGCQAYLGPGHEQCPVLNNHLVWRLLIGFGGLLIAAALAFLFGERALVGKRHISCSP